MTPESSGKEGWGERDAKDIGKETREAPETWEEMWGMTKTDGERGKTSDTGTP